MKRHSWLPSGGVNVFQEVKAMRAAAKAGGKELYNLSIGQPTGAALPSCRMKASELVLSEEEYWHEYQDNDFMPFPNWAKRFVAAHAGVSGEVDYMPTPGTKPMLKNLIIACGIRSRLAKVYTMTEPGYAVPATWCGHGYLSVEHQALTTNPGNGFIPQAVEIADMPENSLLMLNFPHNPSGQSVDGSFWHWVCRICSECGVRLVNDAAYTLLSYQNPTPLAEIAVLYPDLEWVELFSASKEINNGTGWRVGAAVGTPEFISDFRRIKGNDDSGFVAPMAAAALYALEEDRESVFASCHQYQKRTEEVVYPILTASGMRPSVKPRAGFFSLWDLPRRAFGQEITSAKQFNELMISRTGVVGVHFEPGYIRYAVCSPVEDWVKPITEAFEQADVSY